MNLDAHDSVRPILWRDGALWLIDQRLLPQRKEQVVCRDVAAVAEAIRNMTVRGAPAIGITAAYGVVLAARDRFDTASATWKEDIEEDLQLLAGTRPTAVNLFWALDRMRAAIADCGGGPGVRLLEEARAIHEMDIAANRRMGQLGAALIETPCAVLTHCNAGSLATGGFGTALGVIRAGYVTDRIRRVYADETRPWLQGARLTAWELLEDRIPVTLVAEGAGAHLMKQGEVGWLIVGSDRIAANGDVANKIGTYGAAIAARHHGVRVMVVAPTSTIDMGTPDGGAIPIETRKEEELLALANQPTAAPGARAWNPVFDVTPAALVDAIVTEKGVVLAPDAAKMAALMKP
ncbi:MAG: S-methyl-5-thioribose-1-phosphate isomerase [Gammaproteobacteria bacterium]|nr:S-methyl-5-thioribose-1-phosphate isomerase [Gammaproteobacteria bacterium]